MAERGRRRDGGAPAALPVLAVIYGRGSASPMGVRLAARGVCETVFLADLSDPRVAADTALVPRATRIVDTAGMTPEQTCACAAALRPDGVVTFSDAQLRIAAAVAQTCGLRFHDTWTVELLMDKCLQRQALSAAGVQSTACVPLRTADDIAPAIAAVGTPAVLKPRSGAGSVDTCLVRSEQELAQCYAEFTGGGGAVRQYVLEPYLAGDPAVLGSSWGDYVSVESLVCDGEARTVAVTGKFPLAPPFRETGMFIPAAVPPWLVREVLRLEGAALRALGIRHGTTHTEIKITAGGPRVIEVNGRMGGHLADPLRRAAGVNLIALTLCLALGHCDPPAPVLATGPRCPEVAFLYLLAAPGDDVVPGDTSQLDALRSIPGVELVNATVPPGWRPDWRAGTEWLVGAVYGTAPDHEALRGTIEQIQRRTSAFWRLPARG